MTGTKRPGCTARRGVSVKGIGREASGEHANVAALCTVVGVSVHSTARRRDMCLRAACEARVRHLWGSMARPVRHRAGPPPKPDVTVFSHPAPQSSGCCHEYLGPHSSHLLWSSNRGNGDGRVASWWDDDFHPDYGG